MNFLNSYLKNKYIILAGILTGVIVIAGVGGYLFYYSSKNSAAKPPQEAAEMVVAEVGKLIDLPTGEEPAVATVTDITKLASQPFFQKAKNGDKVLIYANSKKAILYDPIAKKVIDIAPINSSPSAQVAYQAKIALRNGTQLVGLATKVETELKKNQPSINIISKDNSSLKIDYEKTIIVVLNDQAKNEANDLAKTLKGDITSLPAGELKPKDADMLIILGKDTI